MMDKKNLKTLANYPLEYLVLAEQYREKHFPEKEYPEIKIVSIFIKDRCICVKYNNGEWYHYNSDGSWY